MQDELIPRATHPARTRLRACSCVVGFALTTLLSFGTWAQQPPIAPRDDDPQVPGRAPWAEWLKKYPDSADFDGKPLRQLYEAWLPGCTAENREEQLRTITDQYSNSKIAPLIAYKLVDPTGRRVFAKGRGQPETRRKEWQKLLEAHPDAVFPSASEECHTAWEHFPIAGARLAPIVQLNIAKTYEWPRFRERKPIADPTSLDETQKAYRKILDYYPKRLEKDNGIEVEEWSRVILPAYFELINLNFATGNLTEGERLADEVLSFPNRSFGDNGGGESHQEAILVKAEIAVQRKDFESAGRGFRKVALDFGRSGWGFHGGSGDSYLNTAIDLARQSLPKPQADGFVASLGDAAAPTIHLQGKKGDFIVKESTIEERDVFVDVRAVGDGIESLYVTSGAPLLYGGAKRDLATGKGKYVFADPTEWGRDHRYALKDLPPGKIYVEAFDLVGNVTIFPFFVAAASSATSGDTHIGPMEMKSFQVLFPSTSDYSETFIGEVDSGRVFERQLRTGLWFQLRPGREPGYIIWLGDRSHPEEDYCAVVTPPFHGPNALDIWASELVSEVDARLKNRPGRVRRFRCVPDRASYQEADWAVHRVLWPPPAGEPPDTAEKAQRLFDRYQESSLRGSVVVKDVQLDDAGGAEPKIKRMSFEVSFLPAEDSPKGSAREEDDGQTVELSLAEQRTPLPAGLTFSVHVDFVGHPEFIARKRGAGGLWRIAIEPEVTDRELPAWQGGFLVELRDERGQSVRFSDGRFERRFDMADLNRGALRVYRGIHNGIIESVDLPLSRWFDLKPGVYTLRVHYKIYEASTQWSGPSASNVITLRVTQ